MLDYLTEEVLHRLPPEMQRFLQQTAILDRLCGALCDAVTGRSDSQRVLEELKRTNLFIVPLDDRAHWYRYHRLFADLLRHHLQQSEPAQLPLLHRRASGWYAAAGQTAQAVKHALACADHERAAALIAQSADTLRLRGEIGTLQGWLRALPNALLIAHPRLCLAYAWTLTYTGPLDEVEGLLQAAELAPQSDAEGDLEGEIAAVRATAASYQGDSERTISLCRQALSRLSPQQIPLRTTITQALALAYRVTGQVEEAERTLNEVIDLARSTQNIFILIDALCNLSIVQMTQARLHQAAETVDQTLRLITDQQGQAYPIAGEVYVTWAKPLHEWHRLAEADQWLEQGLELGERWGNSDILLSSHHLRARVRLSQGDHAGARAEIGEAIALARQYRVSRLVRQTESFQAQLWVAEGNLRAALRWAEPFGPIDGPPLQQMHETEAISRARLQHALGYSTQARSLLNDLLTAVQTTGRVASTIQLQVLLARCEADAGDSAQARAYLLEALTLAAPSGLIRTFTDEGESLRQPLDELRRQLADPRLRAFAETVLAALAGTAPATPPVTPPESPAKAAPLLDPLSPRELDVLRLMGDGLTNSEIARRLTVETSTVKKHVHNIFAKLAVTHRAQAIARARAFHLL